MAKKNSKPAENIIQPLHDRAMTIIESMSKNMTEAANAYTRALKTFPEMEVFIRKMPAVLWENAKDQSCWGDQLSVYIPWNFEIYAPIEKALKEIGMQMTSEYDPAKRGNKSGYHQFTWKFEDYQYGKPYLTVNLDASKEGSKCVLVPLETVTETVTRIVAYERICPDGHAELFDEQGNFIGEPLLAKDKTKEANNEEPTI